MVLEQMGAQKDGSSGLEPDSAATGSDATHHAADKPEEKSRRHSGPDGAEETASGEPNVKADTVGTGARELVKGEEVSALATITRG